MTLSIKAARERLFSIARPMFDQHGEYANKSIWERWLPNAHVASWEIQSLCTFLKITSLMCCCAWVVSIMYFETVCCAIIPSMKQHCITRILNHKSSGLDSLGNQHSTSCLAEFDPIKIAQWIPRRNRNSWKCNGRSWKLLSIMWVRYFNECT